MAVVTILNEDKRITNAEEITARLASHGIDYERWTPSHPVSDDAAPEAILEAYSHEIEELKTRGLALGLPVTLLVDGEGCLLAHMNGPAEWSSDDAKKLIGVALGG